MDSTKVSKMLGILKYQAGKGKDGERASEATAALDIYKNLGEASERAAFLEAFENSGRGATGFKFGQSFSFKVASKSSRSMSSTEDFYTRRGFGGLLARRPSEF